MNLPSKIAGTLALPLALAIASTSHAATVFENDTHRLNIGGFISAQSTWWEPNDNADMRHDIGLALSRINFNYTDKARGVSYTYEQGFTSGVGGIPSNGIRHAFLSTDSGLVAGWTWTFGAGLIGLTETIDGDGPARAVFGTGGGSQARNGVLGHNFKLADNMSVGVAIEDKADVRGDDPVDTVVPDIAANFKGKFGDVSVFAGVTQYNATVAGDDESFTRISGAVAVPMGPATLRAVITSDDSDLHAALGVGVKINDRVRVNALVENNNYDNPALDDPSQTSVWLNGFYKADSGVEWGAEVQFVSGDDGADPTGDPAGQSMTDGGLAVRLQAKYAF